MVDGPRLDRSQGAPQLVVSGKPFLALGGELGNSTASDLAVLAQALVKAQAMNLNTVMLPVYWDRVEPSEGKFDFSLVEGAVQLARQRNLKLVYLWFGTWKNSMSCYAPSWVKRDTRRFPRVVTQSGETMEIVSPASVEARQADARAFGALMKWTKDHDDQYSTVILAQVNNEVGIIPDARDHSALSDAEFKSQVPAKLLAQLGSLGAEVDKVWHDAGSRREGTWAQVFGDTKQGEEVFSAWQLSRYLEAVAQAGKAEHNIPMFANAALIRPGYQPGQYPSAGPLPHLMEVWRIGAPSLDMISPDIYFPSFAEWGEKYKRGGNPLFIPEMSGTARVAGNAVYGVGHLGAMGLGPFAFENMAEDRRNDLSEAYRLMGGMCELILSARQKGQIIGLGPQIKIDWTDSAEPQSGRLGGVEFRATFDRQGGSGQVAPTSLPTIGSGRWEAPEGTALGAALIVQTGEEEFVVLGRGVVVTFAPASGTGKVGIDSVQEGEYVGGQWRGGRWLNGDETHQGRHIHLYDGRWSVQKVRLYRYE